MCLHNNFFYPKPYHQQTKKNHLLSYQYFRLQTTCKSSIKTLSSMVLHMLHWEIVESSCWVLNPAQPMLSQCSVSLATIFCSTRLCYFFKCLLFKLPPLLPLNLCQGKDLKTLFKVRAIQNKHWDKYWAFGCSVFVHYLAPHIQNKYWDKYWAFGHSVFVQCLAPHSKNTLRQTLSDWTLSVCAMFDPSLVVCIMIDFFN